MSTLHSGSLIIGHSNPHCATFHFASLYCPSSPGQTQADDGAFQIEGGGQKVPLKKAGAQPKLGIAPSISLEDQAWHGVWVTCVPMVSVCLHQLQTI